MKDLTRRNVLGKLAYLFLFLYGGTLFAKGLLKDSASKPSILKPQRDPRTNFHTIFSNPKLKEEFLHFLENVYHIYPEKEFHQLIAQVSENQKSDSDIYRALQKELPKISSVLRPITFALPALGTQKLEMARQATELLGTSRTYQGYVEIGTPGRYVQAMKNRIKIEGPTYLVHTQEPGFSPEDIVERGQLTRIGNYIPLSDYAPLTGIPDASVDLVSNYIGLHHSPRNRLDEFVRSIWKTLKPGGRFLLRDHDVDSDSMDAMVALAHDVFNCGLGVPWEKNEEELRFFKSFKYIEEYLAQQGFKRTGALLAQSGDPTRNLLMVFEKSKL